MISDRDRLAAEARSAAARAGRPKAVSAHYDDVADRIVVHLDTGAELVFAPRDMKWLEGATLAQLGRIDISPLGDGLHWPDLDADIFLPPLF